MTTTTLPTGSWSINYHHAPLPIGGGSGSNPPFERCSNLNLDGHANPDSCASTVNPSAPTLGHPGGQHTVGTTTTLDLPANGGNLLDARAASTQPVAASYLPPTPTRHRKLATEFPRPLPLPPSQSRETQRFGRISAKGSGGRCDRP